MCAIIGVYSKEPLNHNYVNILLFKELLIQSKIRGKHATGVSYYHNGKFDSELFTHKYSISSDKFVEKYDFSKINMNSIIGHCRYSTSDLEFNQPIDNGIESIVHNGVITQSDPLLWENKYGYKCEGKNDSELILHCIESKKEPLIEFKESSLAVIYLRSDNALIFYRNKYRPLWYFQYGNSLFITSTENILKRSFKKVLNIDVDPIECLSGHKYKIDNSGLSKDNLLLESSDLQIKLECTKYYTNERN